MHFAKHALIYVLRFVEAIKKFQILFFVNGSIFRHECPLNGRVRNIFVSFGEKRLNRFNFKLVVQSELYLVYKTEYFYRIWRELEKKTMNPSVNKGTTI